MSSHHFVKEQQEPALFFHNIENLEIDDVTGLLEWSPLIICNDECFQKLISWDIRVDYLLGASGLDYNPHGTERIEQKNMGELETVLKFLVDRKHHAVNIVSVQSFNELRAEFENNVVYLRTLSVTCFGSTSMFSYIRSKSFDKWLPKGSSFNLFFSITSPQVVGKLEINKGEGRLAARVIEDGQVHIQSTDDFWIEEMLK